ncbi:hypothetical protein IMG5_100780 [Ichthyophthirius multifiliis]|uniref:non-specific serine/threonine protein kinase n=1 Tax=Ichthyophthirius multifiliis TaxID=5932 RepID=G0QSF5_ICHMU|nr:hypothetical protein IMG5_100780 [Ichthyophthirius multifiliis]EGR31856.1 hypothetical protein IMG5_100780 [Ichthyophthirius multifiliis]|eukprot:XP_004035342.1 hypothetical protein IMG5_100780 [Ichthyophthirius multifiliis]
MAQKNIGKSVKINRTKCLSIHSTLNYQFARGQFIQNYQKNYESYSKISLQYYGDNTKYFDSDVQLGNGTFGNVYVGKTNKNETIAIKRLNEFYKWEQHYQEIFILKHINNVPHIAHLYDVIREQKYPNTTSFIFEFINGTTLHKSARNLTSDYEVRYLSYILLKTLNQTHELNVIHNDLKGCNIQINLEQLSLKVLDWGISYIYHPYQIKSNIGGTVNYKSPEQLLNSNFVSHFTPAIDVFAAGLLIANLMYRGTDLFYSHFDYEVFSKQIQFFGYKKMTKLSALLNVNINSTIYSNFTLNRTGFYHNSYLKRRQFITTDGINLLQQMLQINPADRISISEALQHKYFDSIRNVQESLFHDN